MFNGQGASTVFDLTVNGVSCLQLPTAAEGPVFVWIEYTYHQQFAHPHICDDLPNHPACLFVDVFGGAHHYAAVGLSGAQRPQGGPDLSPWQPAQC